jgi:hypothetical protein
MNLVGWISPFMHNVRYLYLPGVWIFLLLAEGRPARWYWMAALVALNAISAAYNYSVFRWYEFPI